MLGNPADQMGQMFAPCDIDAERNDRGELLLCNSLKLPDHPSALIKPLRRWARKTPDAPFMREREGEGWRAISYAAFLQAARARAGQLRSAMSAGRAPILILSPNSIDHALTAFGAMMIGSPVAPVSPAYALMTDNFDRLESIIDTLQPGGVYVADPAVFARALPVLEKSVDGPILSARSEGAVSSFDDFETGDLDAVDSIAKALDPQAIAKIMFTSGSTGVPKGVINTHGMLCSNQAALQSIWLFLQQEPPELTDWLPWSHTFGGNVCVNLTLFNGGVLNIDDGKPTPQLISRTVENLQTSSPNIHFNVPSGIEALLPALEQDQDLAKHFFAGLNVLFVAGAALPQKARERLEAAARKATGGMPAIIGGWGSTETAPFSTCVYFDIERAENIGAPIPGTVIKLSPDQDKLALSVKGPNVTPGYWRNEDATGDAFDDDGFYRMGDAGRLADEKDPSKGILFDGRLSENFKLKSGTWVNVGAVRLKVVDCLSPLCTDAVITGHNEDDIGVLLAPNASAIASFLGVPDDQTIPELIRNESLADHVRDKLSEHNAANPGTSTRIARFAFLPRLPSIGRNEITDKGYINQRAMLSAWDKLIAAMHGLGVSGSENAADTRITVL